MRKKRTILADTITITTHHCRKKGKENRAPKTFFSCNCRVFGSRSSSIEAQRSEIQQLRGKRL